MIQVKNLEYVYQKSGKRAVQKIDFSIDQGEIFGFLGPSGAGKTTTQRILIGLLHGYDGSVQIMGKERKLWKQDFFENIGVAFDFPNLYVKLTGMENLELIQSYYQNQSQDIHELMRRVGLQADKDKKVEGYSKGMKMRLNFIRAIMHDPKLLFFDEPTSGLDPVNAKIIKDMIMELKQQGKTIFLTTHNMTVAEQLCDRVAFIVDGQIPVIEKPSELMVEHGTQVVQLDYYSHGQECREAFPMKTIQKNEQFFQIMREHKIKRIHSQEATLEDVFIKLTGRELA